MGIFDETTPIGGSSTMPPLFPATMAPPSTLPGQMPAAPKANALQMIASMLQKSPLPQLLGAGGAGGQTSPNEVRPAVQGQAPANIVGPPGAGQMTPPAAAAPQRPAGQAPQFGAEFMQNLNPSGQAVYSALTGVQKVISDYQNRQDQREHAEAENIASNLTQAVNSKDWNRVEAIMDDPHAMKVINKVFKGWLQQDKESQAAQAKKSQKPEKADPAQQGFESGVAKAAIAAPPGAQPGTPQGTPPGQDPRSIGGYYIPRESPTAAMQSQLDTQKLQNQLAAAQAEGQLKPEELQTAARIKAGVQLPAEKALQAQLKDIEERARIQIATTNAQAALDKSHAEMQVWALKNRNELIKGAAASDKLKWEHMDNLVKYQTALARLQMAKAGGKITPEMAGKLASAESAVQVMQAIVDGKGDVTKNTLTNAKALLESAKLPQAKMINEGGMVKNPLGAGILSTPLVRSKATTTDELKRMIPSIQGWIDGVRGGATPAAQQAPAGASPDVSVTGAPGGAGDVTISEEQFKAGSAPAKAAPAAAPSDEEDDDEDDEEN